MITLWEYNAVTGYWRHGRECEPDTAARWLEIWQRDRPAGHVVLAKRRPRAAPRKEIAA